MKFGEHFTFVSEQRVRNDPKYGEVLRAAEQLAAKQSDEHTPSPSRRSARKKRPMKTKDSGVTANPARDTHDL